MMGALLILMHMCYIARMFETKDVLMLFCAHVYKDPSIKKQRYIYFFYGAGATLGMV